jgi:hypothetical protein
MPDRDKNGLDFSHAPAHDVEKITALKSFLDTANIVCEIYESYFSIA